MMCSVFQSKMNMRRIGQSGAAERSTSIAGKDIESLAKHLPVSKNSPYALFVGLVFPLLDFPKTSLENLE